MASSHITSWQIDGETVEILADFSWVPKSLQMVTSVMKLKELAPWKKSYDRPRLCIKSRDITLLTKVHMVKAVVFPVVMYGCESWTMQC